MPYFIFSLLFLLASCEAIVQNGTPAMRQDIQMAVQDFCKSQNIQMELSQKMAKLKETGQLPGEDINAAMEEINKYAEKYANSLKEISVKYKGQERAYANLIKEAQKRCK